MHDPRLHDSWCAADSTQQSALQEAMAAQALELVEFRGDEHVLDIGCGDGRISARIAAQRVPRGSVCGIDASPDMIEFAQRRYGGVANLHFRVADAREMRLDGGFDAITSFNELHWVPDLTPVLQSLRAALVPDGRAWLRLVTQGPVTSIETVAEQVRRDPAWAPLFAGFENPCLRLDAEQVAARALGAGLGVLSLRTRLQTWNFGSRAGLGGFCRAGFGAWTRRLPPDRHDAFAGAVIDRYVAAHGADERALLRFYQTDLALMRG